MPRYRKYKYNKKPKYKRRRYRGKAKNRQQLLSVKTVEKIATKQAKKEIGDVIESNLLEYYYGEKINLLSAPTALVHLGTNSENGKDWRYGGSLNLYSATFMRPLTFFNSETTFISNSIFSHDPVASYYENGTLPVMKVTAQGAKRIGPELELTYLRVRVEMGPPPQYTKDTAASDNPAYRQDTRDTKIRLMIVRARESDLTFSDVFPEVNTNINNLTENDRKKYSVMVDKTFLIRGQINTQRPVKKYFNWNLPKPKKYKFGSNTAYEPVKGQLYLVMRSDVSTTHSDNNSYPYGEARPQVRIQIRQYTKDT